MKIRVFISSVQKELTDERMALQILLSTDPFLCQHCVPILLKITPCYYIQKKSLIWMF